MLSAVQIKDGRPCFELDAEEWIFQFKREQEGEDRIVMFHVKPYLASEMKRMLNATGVVMKSDGGANLLMLPGSQEACKPLFKSNFIKMGAKKPDGTEPTYEEQLKFIEDIGWEAEIVRSTYGGFAVKPKPSKDNSSAFVFSVGPKETSTDLIVKLWCQETGVVEDIICGHFTRNPTAQHRFDHAAATSGRQLNSRRGEVRSREDLDVKERLYDEMIIRLDGVLIQENPCVADNKELWVPKVPFWHKSVVVDEVFERDSLKNV